VLAPSLAAFLWFSVFGGSALTMQIWQHVPIAAAVKNDVATGLFTMFGAMPFGLAMSVVATLLVLVFFVTSGDSAVLVLGMMSTGGNPNPPARIKLIWGVTIAALPFALLMLAVMWSLYRVLDMEYQLQRRRALRARRMMDAWIEREIAAQEETRDEASRAET
jgi:glycine betaine transporter